MTNPSFLALRGGEAVSYRQAGVHETGPGCVSTRARVVSPDLRSG